MVLWCSAAHGLLSESVGSWWSDGTGIAKTENEEHAYKLCRLPNRRGDSVSGGKSAIGLAWMWLKACSR